MVVKQFAGTTKSDLEALQVPTVDSYTGWYGLFEYVIATGLEGSVLMYPVEYKGESVSLNPQYMNIGEAYSFVFSGHYLVAIKQQDETIDFYHLE